MRGGSSDPGCKKSTTSTAESRRAELRNGDEEPGCKKSIADNEYTLPTRVSPRAGKDDPSRTKLREESGEPGCKKSNADVADPMRKCERRDEEDPM